MKKAIQSVSFFTFTALFAFGMLVSSCKKEVPGPTGATGAAGPSAKTYLVDLTYNAGDVSKSFYAVTDYDSDDVILAFLSVNSGSSYLQLPTTYEGIKYEVTNSTYSSTIGAIQVSTYNASDGYTSPWASAWTLHYKFVHIKSSELKKHPEVDLSNYIEVKETFNL